MKSVFFLFLFFTSTTLFAQKVPRPTVNRVRIADTAGTVVAEINPVPQHYQAKANLYYYWFSGNSVQITQGGYSGKLLNGDYTAYYPNKNLKAQGHFDNGLKNGTWMAWDTNGLITVITQWKNGKEVQPKTALWKRLHFFRKKKKVNDTTKKNA